MQQKQQILYFQKVFATALRNHEAADHFESLLRLARALQTSAHREDPSFWISKS